MESLNMNQMELQIKTCDMHTAGEPVRIVESGYPEVHGATMFEKRAYASEHSEVREFLMNEPRGHFNMYGAIITKPCTADADFGVLFINNDGFSTMCGHAVIALGRYAVDKGLVKASCPETLVVIDCVCGPVKAYVEYKDGCSGRVRFHSVPSFVFKLGAEVQTKTFGMVKVDIAYGGTFYAVVSASDISLDIKLTPLHILVEAATQITEGIKDQIKLYHPDGPEGLAFIYGTILTDGKDAEVDLTSENICVFAKREVDRSPTGSGVTARMAIQFKKKYAQLHQKKQFCGLSKMEFSGEVVEETKCGEFDAVVVEVSGIAFYTGEHKFYLEKRDCLKRGLQIEF